MRNHQEKGFVLIVALTILALVAVAIFVLVEISRSLTFESNRAYIQACHRNMTASALAWANENRKDLTAGKEPKVISLDIETLKIKGGSLAIELLETKEKTTKVAIATKCQRGRMKLNRRDTYRVIQDSRINK